jgi:putative ABC transport system permease protein
MLTFALVLSVGTGLLFGVLPAAQAVRINIVSRVGSGSRSTDARGQRFHSCLVIAQVAVSLMLLIGAGLLLKSFAELSAVNPGFDTKNLLTTEIRLASDKYPEEARRIEFFSALTEELRAIPGVTDVAVIDRLPIRDLGNNPSVHAADKPLPDPLDRVAAFRRKVFPGYFEAMGIPLLRGRGIEASDRAQSPPVLVINQTMARTLFPGEDPLGRLVSVWQDGDYEVIGVVGDVRIAGPRFGSRLAMYDSYLHRPALTMRLAIRTANEQASMAEGVRDAVWKQDRDIPITGLVSMDEIIARSVSNDKAVTFSVALFAVIAMLLAALGLYSVLAYYVSRRTNEIGVRIALGAGAREVLMHVMKQGLLLVAAGIALGLVGAFWTSRLLQQLLFGVEPTDATTFVAVSLVFVIIALVACWIPARKALRVNPVDALALQ